MNNDRFKARVWDGAAYFYFDIEKGCHCTVDEDETLELSTGKKDKNGALIFEGHILRNTFYKGDGVDDYEVKFGEFWTCIMEPCSEPVLGWYLSNGVNPDLDDSIMNLLEEPDRMEIIGNIHQHPELLEGEN